MLGHSDGLNQCVSLFDGGHVVVPFLVWRLFIYAPIFPDFFAKDKRQIFPMYIISKMFSFEASHQLKGLPNNPDGSSHKCTQLHGHSYRVELILRRVDLDEHGFVVDYNDMKPFQEYIDEHLDHRHINDVLPGINPTAENIAKHLYGVAWQLWHDVAITVRVSETQKTWASYDEAGV